MTPSPIAADTPDPDAPRRAGAPERLDTIFLTGHGGRVYELPRRVAERYLLSMERMAQLGHLPITPYGVAEQLRSANGGGEVQGRHLVMLPSGAMGFHGDVQYGAFLWTDGHTYVGDHYHPYGTELGFTP
jgi:hypothetical protein